MTVGDMVSLFYPASTMDEMGSFLIVGKVPAWVADVASARATKWDDGAGPVDNVNSVYSECVCECMIF